MGKFGYIIMTKENRKFVIFNTSETGSINFSQVLETSVETLRLNVSGSKTFVKYEGSMPSSLSGLSTKSKAYTYLEMTSELSKSEWIIEDDIIDPEEEALENE
jgi:hypothetical protein|tara:strand:- start:26 stop:334 length:309 start_codon:yes stop_codon:yes gene_type:complete